MKITPFFLYEIFILFAILGKNNTHPLNNNDEISLSLKKHKGKEFNQVSSY